MKERCPNCGLPVGNMPEDASSDELLCNQCYELSNIYYQAKHYTRETGEIIWLSEKSNNEDSILSKTSLYIQALEMRGYIVLATHKEDLTPDTTEEWAVIRKKVIWKMIMK